MLISCLGSIISWIVRLLGDPFFLFFKCLKNKKPIKQFRPIRMSYFYVFGQCVSVVRVEEFPKNSRDLNQTPRSVAFDMGLHYMPMSHQKGHSSSMLPCHLANIHAQTSYKIAQLEPSSFPLLCICEHKLLWFDYEYVLDNDEIRI